MHQKVPERVLPSVSGPAVIVLFPFRYPAFPPSPPRDDKKRPLMQGLPAALGICPRAIILPGFDVLRGGKFGFKGQNIFYATWI